jgi:hypothetical protein
MFHRVLGALAKLVVAVSAAFVSVVGDAAGADNIRYVSVNGSNASLCTQAAPCRTLQRGIDRTPAGGELRILNSGFFGSATTIGKSMTISGMHNTVVLANAITINNANAVVMLRDLVLNGRGSAVSGIEITAAQAVHIERSVVLGFSSTGIRQYLAGADLIVTDSVVRNSGAGLIVQVGDTSARVTVDNTRFESNVGNGIFLAGAGINGAISRTIAMGNGTGIATDRGFIIAVRTVAANNTSAGFNVSDDGGMTLEDCAAHGNQYGLWTNAADSKARVSNSVFVGNAYGIASNGITHTRQDNLVSGNTTDVFGTLTPIGGT